MAQCKSSGFMPVDMPATSVPSALRALAGVGTNTLLASDSAIAPQNSMMTISITPSAAQVSSSVWRMRRHAQAAANSEMSHVQNMSDPWRPAHTPATW